MTRRGEDERRRCRERYRPGRGTQRRRRGGSAPPPMTDNWARRSEDAEGEPPQRRGRGGRAPAGGSSGSDRPEGQPPDGSKCTWDAAETQGGRSRLRASLGGNHERRPCGVCTGAVNLGHCAVRPPRAGTKTTSSRRDPYRWELEACGLKGGRHKIRSPSGERGCAASRGR